MDWDIEEQAAIEHWTEYLTRLGDKYRGVAGLILHDYGLHTGEILTWSSRVQPGLLDIYKKIAKNHPWAPYMWRDPVGTAIFPDERETYIRVSGDVNSEEFVRNLLEHNIAIGMGAVLWKDKHPAPRFVVAIGILKPGDPKAREAFTASEREPFLHQIPFLVDEIKTHPFLARKLMEYAKSS